MDILPQIIWYALLATAVYTLIAIGLTLTFGILDFINFAHGDMATIGGYFLFSLIIMAHLPYWLGFLLVIIGSAGLGILIERLTFRRVRKSHPFKPLIISIGLSALIQAIVILIFGAGVKSYRQIGEDAPAIYSFFNDHLIITQNQIVIVITTLILLGGLGIFLKYSKTGKAIRAVADNKEVAAILGINVNRIIAIIFALGSAFAAIAGMLISAEQNLNPTMGLALAVNAFAAIILGGVGNLTGAILGAAIIGFSENFLIGFTPIPASFVQAIIFSILIITLFVKPNGLWGASIEAEVRK